MADFLSGGIRMVNKGVVDAKLAAAAPAILANNRAMVTEMLRYVKDEVVAATPVGPGITGHLREQYVTDVRSGAITTVGVLKSPAKGYWYEFGTGTRYRGPKKLAAYVHVFTASTGGEAAHFLARRAAAGLRRFIDAYYGGLAKWWGAGV